MIDWSSKVKHIEAGSYLSFSEYCLYRGIDLSISLDFNNYIVTHYPSSYGKDCWLEDWDIMWENFTCPES